MNVKLTGLRKTRILNSDDVFDIMQKILLRENKRDRDKEHFRIIGLNVTNLSVTSSLNTPTSNQALYTDLHYL